MKSTTAHMRQMRLIPDLPSSRLQLSQSIGGVTDSLSVWNASIVQKSVSVSLLSMLPSNDAPVCRDERKIHELRIQNRGRNEAEMGEL